MKVNQRTVNINEKEVPYIHIENGSQAVCFMFSGASYTYDKPLLYFSTMAMLEHKYDVVHIHYSFEQGLFQLPFEEVSTIIGNVVNPVINEVLGQFQYQEIVFLGKSLGTIPIITGLMKSDRYLNAKMILLTPLLKFDSIYEALLECKHSALLVIGEKDPHFIPDKIEALENKTTIRIEKVPNANHSLEMEPFHTSLSITALEKVMERLGDFLKS